LACRLIDFDLCHPTKFMTNSQSVFLLHHALKQGFFEKYWAASQTAMPVQQIIEGRYVEREKLIKLLKTTFGEGNYQVRLQLNRWILSVPKELTEEQIDSCCSLE